MDKNILEDQKAHALIQAQWWIAYATTGAAKNRQLFKSVNSIGDTPLTDEEKIDDSMKTAQHHIQTFRELSGF